MLCLVDNQRMQQLARKFGADLKFDFGSVIGEVDPPRYTPLSLIREVAADVHGVKTAFLDARNGGRLHVIVMFFLAWLT